MGDSLTDPYVGFAFPWQHWLRYVAGHGYRTVNLGVGGDSTAEMCQRVEEFLSEGQPEIAVLFAGNVDAERGIDPADTERNVTFIINWLREHGVRQVALIGPGMLNLPQVPDYMSQVTDWSSAIGPVRAMFRDVAAKTDVVFVDLAEFHRDRIARGVDLDFRRAPYRQSRSWHAVPGDGHFNAYGNRLVAEALLTAIAGSRQTPRSRQPI
jgi:lysophospholipase L1-like esterase